MELVSFSPEAQRGCFAEYDVLDFQYLRHKLSELILQVCGGSLLAIDCAGLPQNHRLVADEATGSC